MPRGVVIAKVKVLINIVFKDLLLFIIINVVLILSFMVKGYNSYFLIKNSTNDVLGSTLKMRGFLPTKINCKLSNFEIFILSLNYFLF